MAQAYGDSGGFYVSFEMPGEWVTVLGIEGGQIKFDSATGTITDAEDSITSANIPSTINGVPVTSILDDTFMYCSSLKSITIPNSVTNIEYNVFIFCDTLESINVDINNPNYTSIDGILFNKDMTKLLKFPEGKNVSSYTIPDSVTSIGDEAFWECNNLKSIIIPNSVTSIGEWAFYGCSSLESIIIPNSVTSIGNSNFNSCSSLKSIIIPNSVTSIGEWAFYGCESLTDVYYNGTKEQWESIQINNVDNYNDYLLEATIHYNSPMTEITTTQTTLSTTTPSQSPPASAPPVKEIILKIGELTGTMDVAPYVDNGNTMIPFRAMANILGVSDDNIGYNNDTQEVTIEYYGRIISCTIGSDQLKVTENGNTTTTTMGNNAKAVTKDWRTFVPIRAISEAFGLQVGWDNDTQTVTLKS